MIKRSFVLACQNEDFRALSNRVHSMVFLATPHRGADLAQLLSKILGLSHGARPYVADLHRNSLATQTINEEFPQYCKTLQLFSFHETLPTSYGVGKSMIVDKDLAILGYHNERSAYLNANHRDVCKFANQSDPNYRTVRNALAAIVEDIRNTEGAIRQDLTDQQHRSLNESLGISDAPEDDFMEIDMLRIHGSCEWLTGREVYLQWQDGLRPQIYWISARPATGKTVLSGMVMNHLKKLRRDIAFFFFDFRSKEKTSISNFLLSIAWQMAKLHYSIFQVVVDISNKEEDLRKADYRTIWRKLFVEGILRGSLGRTLYWVIDAVDECTGESELIQMLLIASQSGFIRVLLTSRHRFESGRQGNRSQVDYHIS